MIQFLNVSKRYENGYNALNNITFQLGRGEMAFLTGHSGAGKSTLLRLIPLMERPSNGQILLNNENLARLSPRRVPYVRRNIGFIFQNPRLLHDRSVFDNVAMPLIILGFSPVEVGKRVRAALDKVGLLSREKANPITLSTGEQQRVGIARAIVHKPALILADEPTGNLDPELSMEIMKLFAEFQQVGASVLVATHDISLIKKMHYRTIMLKVGEIVADGKLPA